MGLNGCGKERGVGWVWCGPAEAPQQGSGAAKAHSRPLTVLRASGSWPASERPRPVQRHASGRVNLQAGLRPAPARQRSAGSSANCTRSRGRAAPASAAASHAVKALAPRRRGAVGAPPRGLQPRQGGGADWPAIAAAGCRPFACGPDQQQAIGRPLQCTAQVHPPSPARYKTPRAAMLPTWLLLRGRQGPDRRTPLL